MSILSRLFESKEARAKRLAEKEAAKSKRLAEEARQRTLDEELRTKRRVDEGKNLFSNLMNDYYAETNPVKQYEILQKAARVADTDDEKLQIVLKLNQLKHDYGLR